MKMTNIKMSTDNYRNIHLVLHNLIELTGSLSTGKDYTPEQYKDILKNINEPLKTIKTTLEAK